MGIQSEQCPGNGHQKQTSGDGSYENECDSYFLADADLAKTPLGLSIRHLRK